MKVLSLILFVLLLFSCKQEDVPDKYQYEILMFRISYNDFEFIEGIELSIEVEEEGNNLLPITTEYQSPGDFGYMKFFHDETSELIFHGEIIWAGTGDIVYPSSWNPASSYLDGLFAPIATPSNERWVVLGNEESFVDFSYDSIWEAISHLNITSLYMEEENTQIGIYQYTPSVGIGNPEEWSWILILHRNQGL